MDIDARLVLMTQHPYLKVAEVAAELEISPDGVYKLIKRGKLPAVRLSERGTRVPRVALDAYRRRLGGENQLPAFSQMSAPDSTALFMVDTGLTPFEWSRRWKASDLEDTPENMRLALRALSLLLADTPTSPNGAAALEAPPVPSAGG